MARVIKDQASDDIWHLSIEDLLAPARESARTAGPGPFVINLRTSSATIGSPPKGLPPTDRLHVYQLARSHDGRPQFQLRLGIIESELEADALLSMVREHYPAAIKETAEDDDKAAIARAARAAAPVKPASAVADAKTPVVQERGKAAPPASRQATPSAARQAAPPAARRAAAESAEHFRWDINELLPELAAVWPPTPEPTLPICTASKGERKPPKLTTPRGFEKAQRPPASAAAPSVKVSARSRPTPPLEKTRQSQTARRVTNAPRVERQESLSVAPTRVLTEPRERVNPAQPPLAKTAQLSVDVSYGVSHAEGAPKSAVVEEIASDPNAITDQVEVLALRIERQIGATEAPLAPGSASSIESSMEQKPLDVPKPAHARPEPGYRSLDASALTGAEPVITTDSPAVDSVPPERRTANAAPTPAADTHASVPVASCEDSGADSKSLQGRAARVAVLMDFAEAHQKSANAPQSDANASVAAAPPPGSCQLIASEPASPNLPPLVPQPPSAQAGAPMMDSTQTVRRLTLLELADGEGSCWFAIQLMLREEPIDAEQVPSLGIFTEYRLCSVTGLEQDRVMHALRVGFFSSELAAEAVAGYLVAYFDSPVVRRVSITERERFADAGVAARKDVGTAAMHAVIELATPAPPAERRLAAPSDRRAAPSDRRKSAASQATSLWSRLVAPRDR
ncbi:MAG: hypothetical protein E6K48_08430 [Gammaproteobacteria bacterium]|nr:MAG: hypothetical protein E6K48_08430 [Gammaproteobacteria bacterium]